MEIVLAFGWLRPLSLRSFQVNPPDGAPMVTFLGRTREGALEFAVPAVLLVVLYGIAVRVSGRARGRAAILVTLSAPALFAVTLIPMFPGGTQDIFHNVADGRLFWRYGENPTLIPPSSHPEDAFYPHLFGYADLSSAYGPVWYLLDGIPTGIAGDGLVANLVAQKAMMSAFLMATVVLVAWAAAGSTRALLAGERGSVQAAVLAGWCPLLLWEFPGNGHNDIIMVFFAAAAVVAAIRGWWVWVLPLLALSALVKVTTVLLGPVLLVWLVRQHGVRWRAVAFGAAIAAALTFLAYVPFWAGRDTLRFLDRPGMTVILSPATLLYGALASTLSTDAALRSAYALTGAVFVLLYALALRRAAREDESVIRPAFDALFAYLVFASWWFWPWYLSWLAPLAALAPGPDRRRWAYVLITGTALLSYCYWWDDPVERSRRWVELYTALTIAVFLLPTIVWAWPTMPMRRRRAVSSMISGDRGGTGAAPPAGRPHG
jgi:alpha-1,6-mannosyltransferase